MKSSRYRKHERWGDWRIADLTPEQLALLAKHREVPLLVYVNDVYEVWKYKAEVHADWPAMWHLSIKRRFTKEVIRDWRHLQRIKNELIGPEHEAVEIFPAESRLMDTSNQYHLWVLADPTLAFPFGTYGRAIVSGGTFDDGARQRPFEPGTEPADAISPAEAARRLAEQRDKETAHE